MLNKENQQPTYHKHPRTPCHLLAHARRMRRAPTPAEAKLWRALRDRQLGIKFRRQQPVGQYVVDFCCFAHHLVVEIDGDVHAFHVEEDDRRESELRALGYTVLRFTNGQVLKELDAVVTEIARHCDEPPSP